MVDRGGEADDQLVPSPLLLPPACAPDTPRVTPPGLSGVDAGALGPGPQPGSGPGVEVDAGRAGHATDVMMGTRGVVRLGETTRGSGVGGAAAGL